MSAEAKAAFVATQARLRALREAGWEDSMEAHVLRDEKDKLWPLLTAEEQRELTWQTYRESLAEDREEPSERPSPQQHRSLYYFRSELDEQAYEVGFATHEE